MNFSTFWTYFRKKIIKYQTSWKSVRWEPSFLHFDERTDGLTDIQTPDGRTDVTSLIVVLRKFSNAPKNQLCCVWLCNYCRTIIDCAGNWSPDAIPYRNRYSEWGTVQPINKVAPKIMYRIKNKMLRKSSVVVFQNLLIRHSKKIESYSNFSYRW